MTRNACLTIALAAALVVVPSGLSVRPPPIPAAAATTCPVHFLGLHGLNESSDLRSDPINETWKTFESAVAAKAARPIRDLIFFPKVTTQEFLGKTFKSRTGVEPDVNAGVSAVQRAMDRAVRQCPSTKFVLAGYSLGAWVVDKFLLTDPHRRPLVLAAQLYGDPQWNDPGKGKGLAAILGRGLHTPYPPFPDRVQSLCNHRDPVCGTGYRAGPRDLKLRAGDLKGVKCPGSAHCYSGRSTTQGGQFLASRANVDWNNRAYRLTCDDIVSKAVPVSVRNGQGDARGSGIGDYDRWQVQIQRITRGTVPRLGDVTAVLFSCSPQPSNFRLQELRIYRTTDGREVGRTPTFQVAELSPQYQPDTVRFRNGRLLADVKFYGPGDSHATGPSILRHVTWRWDGSRFVKQSQIDAKKPSRTELGTQRVTVKGIGPLQMGMTRTEAERAIGARIPEGPGGPDCKDLSIEGGPEGLLLRFSNDDRLVAISVLSPASISTASGIHRGSTRDEVLTTYAREIKEPNTDELVFTPSGAQFQGKVITFAMDDNGEVDRFIAGEKEFAIPLPCGSD
ncbi:Cutinase [Streptomyces sp. 2333.5]|uniref:cutinase family protein n=1 Tax=unclassified Streptomyces TaxID=2593676 RepID=UPI000897E320|nr:MULTISPECIES: cutinase family protein [unclassified Streptomyces]PJJ05249.1 Cutinase [Streptomyces sp. 2333.5]SEE71587.1 Cutinase [Streptomyces sp. 2314.4]SEE96531.1 Cutinase [Streptomyces sp. 2112.2]